jgi:hypothetical protein
VRVVPDGLKRALQPVVRNPKTGVVLGGIQKVVRHAGQHPEHQNLAHHELLTDTGSKHVWADKHQMRRLAEKGGITYELGLKKGAESSMPEDMETVEAVLPEEQAADIERALNATDAQRLRDAVHKSLGQMIAKGILARLPQPAAPPEAQPEAPAVQPESPDADA